MRRAALLTAAVLAVALAGAAPAGAHAFLTKSEPASGAVVRAAPHEVRLVFTEPVRPASGMKVVRGGGGSVVAGSPFVPAGKTNEIVIPLRPRLGPGPYAVTWSEVDVEDGHLISGAFIFSIGAGLPPTRTGPAQGQNGPPPSAVISRWLLLAGVLVAAGSVGFWFLVMRPVLRTTAGTPALVARADRARTLVLAAALGVATLGAVLSVLFEADATSTRFGRWTLVGACVAAVGTALALAPRLRAAASVVAVGLLGLPTATGHASLSGVPRALAVPADLAHLAAAAFWLGGILELAVVAPISLRKQLARRFAPFALASVALLGVTGVIRAFNELDALHQVWTTGYGRTLIVKTGVLAALLGSAWLNTRRLGAGPLDRAGIGAELALLAVVIGAVALLTNLRPGRAEANTATTAAASPNVVFAGQDNDLAVALSATPRRGRKVALRATVLGWKGRVPGLEIGFAVTSGGATERAAATACGAGCYRAALPVDGRPRVFSVRVAGRGRPAATLRFAAPAQWPAPPAIDIVRKSERAINALRTMVVRSRLASDAEHEVSTIYKMVAPDRLAYHNVGSSDSVIVGNRRWDRQSGGRWVESPQVPPIQQPAPFWPPNVVDAHVLRTARVAGHSVWVVSFLDPTTPAWFTAWIDRSSFRTLQLEMVAAAHFMHDRDGPFNGPIRVEPPTS